MTTVVTVPALLREKGDAYRYALPCRGMQPARPHLPTSPPPARPPSRPPVRGWIGTQLPGRRLLVVGGWGVWGALPPRRRARHVRREARAAVSPGGTPPAAAARPCRVVAVGRSPAAGGVGPPPRAPAGGDTTPMLWRRPTRPAPTNCLAALPDGIDSRVGTKGSRLDGGQRQPVCTARALVGGPAFLLADDATASLDTHPGAGGARHTPPRRRHSRDGGNCLPAVHGTGCRCHCGGRGGRPRCRDEVRRLAISNAEVKEASHGADAGLSETADNIIRTVTTLGVQREFLCRF